MKPNTKRGKGEFGWGGGVVTPVFLGVLCYVVCFLVVRAVVEAFRVEGVHGFDPLFLLL